VLAALAAEIRGEDDPAPAPPPPRELGDRIGLPRERMWRAPTAQDWARPVLLTFQRTWDDAVAVSKESGRPILVCINMDGEIASEHYAGVRYRDPEIAAIYEPYVCVIASVYRHVPRDHDDEGRRILCPRFGSVTCGEHIAIEPTIYEKFCDGQRIAPRHVMVDLDGKEVYDVFYANDTASVFEAIQGGVQGWPAPTPVVRGDRPIVDRVGSRDVRDRTAVEAAYDGGDAALRKLLLEAAIANPGSAPLDLLRQAVFGLDPDLSRLAREALAKSDAVGAVTLISDSLRVPMDAPERDALIAALKRMGEGSPLAWWLAGVHQGLSGATPSVDVGAWESATAGGAAYAPPSPPDADEVTRRLEAQARAAEASPDDAAPRLAFAEAALALAEEAPRTYASEPAFARRVQRALYEDARRAATEAEARGATGWRLETALSLAAYYTGDKPEAYARAAKAMKDLPPGEPSWNTMAVVTVFAESRWTAIKEAVKARKEWPSQWLADLHAAYAILQRHPLGTVDQVVWHYEFLLWLGAEHRAERVLTAALDRFWDSEALHERLRQRLVEKRGVEALEATYADLAAKPETGPRLLPFAGIATVAVAEHHRRARAYEEALNAYARAAERFEAALAAGTTSREYADHAIALVHAARARVHFQLEQDEAAHQAILQAFARRPASAGTRDGMGITPGETAQVLLARLTANGKADLATALAEAMGGLDPDLLLPDGE
jgi:hypothetical protein